MTLIEELEKRGLLNNCTNKELLEKLIKNNSSFYLGIDPTSDSLHLGHYQNLILIQLLKKHGLKPYIVIGGATGIIGDPSGKKSEREFLNEKVLKLNIKALKKQLRWLISNDIQILNNYDWIQKMDLFQYFKEIGKKMNINYMLNKESIKERLKTGISYTEFSYILLQSYDFWYLYSKKNIKLQIGGSDQWGNITSGIEFIRKQTNEKNDAMGLTVNLLLDKNGNKYGKSEGKPIWLDKSKTTAYEMFQFFLNETDEKATELLWRLTTLDFSFISKVIEKHQKWPHLKIIQNELAKTIIFHIHGKQAYEEAHEISTILFKKELSKLSQNKFLFVIQSLPKTIINKEKEIIYILEDAKFTSSRRETREHISAGALFLNGQKVLSEKFVLKKENAIFGKYHIIRIGRKKHFIVEQN